MSTHLSPGAQRSAEFYSFAHYTLHEELNARLSFHTIKEEDAIMNAVNDSFPIRLLWAVRFTCSRDVFGTIRPWRIP